VFEFAGARASVLEGAARSPAFKRVLLGERGAELSFTRVGFTQSFFSDRPIELVSDGELKATAFRYETGVAGLRVQNSRSSMVVLPYMGMQVWSVSFDGRDVTQKSMFDMPLATTKFGDNYGAFLYHCGLNNVNGPEEGEDPYLMHDVLPFAVYENTYTGVGVDEEGRYLAVGGTYVFRNSQELHWAYAPELRLYEGKTMVEMRATVHNRRTHPLEYLWLCHMNWLGMDGGRFYYSAPQDPDHVLVAPTELGNDSPRAVAIREWGRKLASDPTLADVLDSSSQVYDPEMCINYRYETDEDGWAHSLMELPGGGSYYVAWDATKAPYALRWLCRTGDEDGVGIAVPSTGTNRGSAYQREHGHFNTLGPGESDVLRWRFGLLDERETNDAKACIDAILGR
jgi:hypothetical protein